MLTFVWIGGLQNVGQAFRMFNIKSRRWIQTCSIQFLALILIMNHLEQVTDLSGPPSLYQEVRE